MLLSHMNRGRFVYSCVHSRGCASNFSFVAPRALYINLLMRTADIQVGEAKVSNVDPGDSVLNSLRSVSLSRV